jgi:ATP-dependent DNA helicase RecG
MRQLLESNEKEIRNPAIVNAFRRIGLSDQAGTGIRAIFRNWHDLGHRPPEIVNDKAGKEFRLILRHEPLITDSIKIFQARLGVKLSAEQAEVLALASSQESITLTEAAMATGGQIQRGNESIKYLLSQKLLDKLEESTFALSSTVKKQLERYAAREPIQTQPEVTGEVTGEVLRLLADYVRVIKANTTPIGNQSPKVGFVCGRLNEF